MKHKHVFGKVVDMHWANLFLGNVKKCIYCDYALHEVYDGKWEQVTREEVDAYVADAKFSKALRFGFDSHGA